MKPFAETARETQRRPQDPRKSQNVASSLVGRSPRRCRHCRHRRRSGRGCGRCLAAAAIADAAIAEAKDKKEWADVDIDEATAATIAAAEKRRSLSATVRMAIAADPSRSPPSRRGPFQDRPPPPKPLPQPVVSISTPPASSSALTLAVSPRPRQSARGPPGRSFQMRASVPQSDSRHGRFQWKICRRRRFLTTVRPCPPRHLESASYLLRSRISGDSCKCK